MDPMEVKSYRPISKLLERLVSKQLLTYLKDNGLLPKLQSAFRAYHRTRQQFLRWWATFYMNWIPATSHYWRCWIFQQHLIVSTTAFFSGGCRSHDTAFTELSLAGLLLTSPVEVSMSALQHPNPPCHLSCMACRKGQSSGRSCFSCK